MGRLEGKVAIVFGAGPTIVSGNARPSRGNARSSCEKALRRRHAATIQRRSYRERSHGA